MYETKESWIAFSVGATHGPAFVYFGSDEARFREVFGEFKRVVPAIPVVSSTSIWEIA